MQDQFFTERLAQSLGVPCQLFSMPAPKEYEEGESWEAQARKLRKKEYARLPKNEYVMTAHHGDDLAETLLWRLFTGSLQTHGGGILFRKANELRPFLLSRKEFLEAYLEEEGVNYQEDLTNTDTRFLRAAMRNKLIPEIEKLFPKSHSEFDSRRHSCSKREEELAIPTLA